ncbi:MAG: cell division protein ZapA, partial [Cyclobacteriaceae bacterium]|nr:cell division protein ZapA [Cyclobacteriaceae bacterium]
MEELSIRLKIAGKEYPMKVKREEEERVRLAAKIVNEKVKSYKEQFRIDDKQDLLAMTAFDGVIKRLRMENQSSGMDNE